MLDLVGHLHTLPYLSAVTSGPAALALHLMGHLWALPHPSEATSSPTTLVLHFTLHFIYLLAFLQATWDLLNELQSLLNDGKEGNAKITVTK